MTGTPSGEAPPTKPKKKVRGEAGVPELEPLIPALIEPNGLE